MTINVKKLINPILYFLGGLLGFIFLGVNQISAFVKIDGESQVQPLINAYKFFEMDLGGSSDFKGAFLMILALLCTIVIIVASIALIGVSVVKILKEVGIEIPFVDIFSKVGKIATLVFMIASCASFFFLLILGLINTVSETYYGLYKYTAGLTPGAGAYLLMIFSVVIFVATTVLENLFANDDKPKTAYVCTACGKTCKAGSQFCDACGAPVAAQIQYPTAYLCSACGHKAKASEKFCSACGGAIVQQVVYPTVRICTACGQKAGKNDKFCVSCGGAVVEKTLTPEEQQPTA